MRPKFYPYQKPAKEQVAKTVSNLENTESSTSRVGDKSTTLKIKIKNLEEFKHLADEFKQKSSELHSLIQRIDGFKIELNANPSNNH